PIPGQEATAPGDVTRSDYQKTKKKKPYKIPKLDRSKPKASGSKPYEKKPKKGENKWKETFRMARVLMEVKDAIKE
ncbi:hypothetical protein PTTG_30298, partial [Puccinia triticina 1-1 BBBD Race 1]